MEGTLAVRAYDHSRIKVFRLRCKLTQYKASQLAGFSVDTWRDYEQGRSTPSVERLFLIADTLGVRLDDFATNTGNEGTNDACSQTNTARS
jgi:transcriptional regulator with XRE-family HTH domain